MKRTMNLLFFIIVSSCAVIKSAEQEQFNGPIKYKIFFDKAVATKDINTVFSILTSENKDLKALINHYPLAMKLYRILTNNSDGEDFSLEARYIRIENILFVAGVLALKGGNTLFMDNLKIILG